jgi:hypothetical protein
MASVPVDRRGFASAMRAFFLNTGMVISMTIAMPLLIGLMPLDQMMDMFIVGSAHLPIETQIRFTNAICFVFAVSAILSVPAIIVSALRGKDDLTCRENMG